MEATLQIQRAANWVIPCTWDALHWLEPGNCSPDCRESRTRHYGSSNSYFRVTLQIWSCDLSSMIPIHNMALEAPILTCLQFVLTRSTHVYDSNIWCHDQLALDISSASIAFLIAVKVRLAVVFFQFLWSFWVLSLCLRLPSKGFWCILI